MFTCGRRKLNFFKTLTSQLLNFNPILNAELMNKLALNQPFKFLFRDIFVTLKIGWLQNLHDLSILERDIEGANRWS